MKRAVCCAWVLLLLLCSIAAAAPAQAAEGTYPDRFMLRLGGYRVSNAENIARLDANDLPVGIYIDFPKNLGVDSTATVARLDGLYRFNEHHGLGFAWYSIDFTGKRDLSKDIQWGNLPPLTIGTHVESELKFDVFKVNYQYSVFHNDEVEVGALFGFHVLKAFVSIDAVGIGESKSTGITAPLPVLGFYADYHFTPRASVYYNYQLFAVDYENRIKGGMQDFIFGVEYRLHRNVAVGAAYNRYALDLEVVDTSTTLYLNSSWNGTMLYGSLYF